MGLFQLELQRRIRVREGGQELFRFGPAHGNGLLAVEKLVSTSLHGPEGGHFGHDLGHECRDVLIRHAVQVGDGVLGQLGNLLGVALHLPNRGVGRRLIQKHPVPALLELQPGHAGLVEFLVLGKTLVGLIVPDCGLSACAHRDRKYDSAHVPLS